MNKDGSGEFKFTANFSQSKTKLKSIMLMEKVNGYKVPTKKEITKEINSIYELAKKTKGISQVKKQINFEDFIFSISCKFDSVESLNKVVKRIRLSKKIKNSSQDNQFEYNKSKKIFIRNFDHGLKQEFNRLKPADKKVLKNASFVSIYRFKNEIKSKTNSKTKVSPNKKASMLKLNIVDVANKKATIKNTIKLK